MILSKKALLLRIALYLLAAIILILGVFWLPGLANHTAAEFPEHAHLRYPVLIGMYATAVPFFYAFYQADYLLRLIAKNKAFVSRGLKFLQNIIYCAYTIVVLYLIGGIYLLMNQALHLGIALFGFGVLFVCAMVVVLAFILQELLKQVLEIKSENELTI